MLKGGLTRERDVGQVVVQRVATQLEKHYNTGYVYATRVHRRPQCCMCLGNLHSLKVEDAHMLPV